MRWAMWHVWAFLIVGLFNGLTWLIDEQVHNLILACFAFVMMRIEMLDYDIQARP